MSPHDTDRTERLVGLSLRRPIAVTVLLASTLVLGLVATLGIPIELVPRGFEAPFLHVFVPWRDAPAPEVLDKIVRPLEEELATVGGLDGLRSVSRLGMGGVRIAFKQGTDMDVAYREVRDRVERARRRLPEDVEQVFYRKHDDSAIPILVLGLAIDDTLAGAYDLLQNEVVVPLERIDGVAAVETDGLVEREILIELDRERAAAAGVNIWRLAQQLAMDNFTMASGQVRAADRKLLLRSTATYDSLDELRDRPVTPTARLGDIATVRYDLPDFKFRVRAMSRPAIAVVVQKEGDANTLEVTRRVEQEVERIAANPRLTAIESIELFNQREVILESLSTLVRSGEIGAIFAIGVLFFFLRRLRMTLIITLSIPLSLLVALTVMFLAGESLNIISLLALMISVGLLVDNSVVVAENIFRLHRDGLPRREACVRGASQIALAIVMATLTTVIVFLPASLVEGDGQFFLLRLSVPISVALVASLVVALLLIPLAVYVTLPSNGAGQEPGRVRRTHERLNGALRRAYEASFGRINRAYGRMLSLALSRRAETVMLLLVVFAATLAMFRARVEFVETQKEERGGFEIEVELPPNTAFAETEEYFLACEKAMEKMQEELDLAGYFLFHRTTFGRLEGWFNTPRTNDLKPSEVTERMLAALPRKAGVELYAGEEGEDEEADQGVFAVELYGDDYEQLESLAADLESVLVSVPGVLGARKVADRPMEELALVVERERARAQGVSPQVLATVVGYALRGQALPRATYRGRQIPVRVRFEEDDRSSLAELSDFEVPTTTGETVTVGAMTGVEWLPTSQQIVRRDRRTARTVAVELVEEGRDETRERLGAIVGGLELPEGITRDVRQLGGDDEELRSLMMALLFSIILIYLLMAFLFESFVLPLSIVSTMPLAFLGVVWAHVLLDYDIDFLGVVGIVLLVGVVVNNGIVLIDYVHRLRDAGRGRTEALLVAAERRFRPILMTALTTICGMMPLLAGGANSIGLSYTSFGLTLVGGMTTATLLTLLVVPVFYTLFDDLRLSVTGLVGRLVAWFGRRGRAAESA
ncbi:MAG TPA: efflux RND transporter permease subunit [Thermoanaerobaculia bacterium]|nr:efflux RND transporter permease subunit [Thermoanaerobaculia bacterium]